MSPRARVLAIVGIAAAVLAAYLAGPGAVTGPDYDPRSTQAGGTAGILDVVRSTGSAVDVASDVPASLREETSAVLVLVDGMSTSERDTLRGWTEGGGRLVVADPSSPLVDLELAGGLGTGLVGPVRLPARCPLLSEVGSVLASDWATFEVPEDASGCFPTAGGAWLVRRPVGAGEIIALGGPDALTNRRLAHGDNAVLAVHLLAPEPGSRVVVVPLPRPGSGDASLVDLVPDRVLHLLGGLVGLFALTAWWRGRRLGAPVREPLPLRVPGAALVDGVGDLLQRAGDRAGAAAALRGGLRRDLEPILGLGPETPLELVVARAAARTGLEHDAIVAALDDRPVEDDAALLQLARAAALVRRRAARQGTPGP